MKGQRSEKQVFISCKPFILSLSFSYLVGLLWSKLSVSNSALDPRPWDPRTFPTVGPPLHHSVRRTINIEYCHSFPMSCRTPAQGTKECVYKKGGNKCIHKSDRGSSVGLLCAALVCVFIISKTPEQPEEGVSPPPSASLLLHLLTQCSHTSMSVNNSSAYRSERSFHQTSSSSSTSSSSANPHMEKSRGLFADDFGSFMRPGSDALGFSSKSF